MKLRAAIARLQALFRRRRLDRELDDEILAHLELAERDAVAAGLKPEEAHQAARRNFGGIEQMKENHRDRRSVRWLANLLRDFRYGMGSLARDPGFAAVAIGLLALGIGANSAMFSIVDAVLLKPLPFSEPERMVRVSEAPPGARNGTTTLTFLDWKRQTDIFEALSVEVPTRAAVATGGDPARVSGKLVSADYFQVFGVKPEIGRTFAAGEDQPGAAPVVVLSHAFWQTQFAGDAGVLKRDLVLDGEPHRIVGVLPTGAFDRQEAVFWKPLIFAPDQLNRGQHWLNPIGRLRAGVSIEQAQARMTALRASLNDVIYQKDWGFAVDPFAKLLVGDTLRRSIYLAFGAVLVVLLIACANVANLALAKGATRRKEMAIRASLGASRGRLIAQLLTESLVLCLLGGVAGVALGALMLRAAAPLVAATLPFTADLSMDLRVLGFAATAVMAVLILTGLLPSLQTSFGRLSNAMNQAARGSSGSSVAVRRTIVIGEVAASVVLICGAALLFKSLAKLQQVDPGVRIDHVITMSTDLPTAAYPSPASATRFYEAVVQRLQAVPGVERASVSQGLPLEGVQWGEYLSLPGVRDSLLVRVKLVDPWYFGAMQIPVEAGREIESRDRAGMPPVVVINQEVAGQLSKTFGMANLVGRTVGIWVPGYADMDFAEEYFEDMAEDQPEFDALVDDILDQILSRFDHLPTGDRADKPGGWPESWKCECSAHERDEFIRRIRWFSSNYAPAFGQLVSPLVQGIRVRGPFRPCFTSERFDLVLFDGQGFGHTPESAASVSTHITKRYADVDAILLVDNATQPMLAASLSVLRSVLASGYQRKLAIAFTHTDHVEGPNLPDFSAKRAHVMRSIAAALGGLRETLGASLVEMLERDLDRRCFMLGWLDRPITVKSKGPAREMEQLLAICRDLVLPEIPTEAVPVYDPAGLLFAAQSADGQFQELWKARLGFIVLATIQRKHWATIKALNRRIALSMDNGEYADLRPVAELVARLSESIGRFLDKPFGWHGPVDAVQRQTAINRVRQHVFAELHKFVEDRLVANPLPAWVRAFDDSGRYSTSRRAQAIKDIVEGAAPMPNEAMSRDVAAFLRDLRILVHQSIKEAGGLFTSGEAA